MQATVMRVQLRSGGDYAMLSCGHASTLGVESDETNASLVGATTECGLHNTNRCACYHLMSRHGATGCRYCDCQQQPRPNTLAEDFEMTARYFEEHGQSDTAAEIRTFWQRKHGT